MRYTKKSIIDKEPASTAFRTVVLYHVYIVYMKISVLTAEMATQNHCVENTPPCLAHQSNLQCEKVVLFDEKGGKAEVKTHRQWPYDFQLGF